jgi:hypothetical protein
MDKLTKKTDNLDELFASVEKLLYKQAWAAVAKYGIAFEDALSECHLAFVKATKQFQEGRGTKFSTFLQLKCQWHFLTLASQSKRAPHFVEIELNEELVGVAPVQHSPCLEAVEGLSSEAREIVGLLLETPAEILGVWSPIKPKQLLRRVKRYLQRKRGYSKARLEKAHEEITNTFRQIWATV